MGQSDHLGLSDDSIRVLRSSPFERCLRWLDASLGRVSHDEVVELYLASGDMEVDEFERLLGKCEVADA